ncbi:hypothetical protein [Prevotella sp.]|uniref:hypothetical protein n=1 Tax=Prevotella sp. TaxID=59823 RepID=UPI003AB87159
MNNLTKLLLIVLIFFCFYSCKDKETPIGELEEISIDLKNNSNTYNEEDWLTVTNKLNEVENELEKYKPEYTDEELEKIGYLKGVCATYLFKQNLKTTSRQIHDAIIMLKGSLNGVFETVKEDSTYWNL